MSSSVWLGGHQRQHFPLNSARCPEASQSPRPALYCPLVEGSLGVALTVVLHICSKGKGPWDFPGVSGVKILFPVQE